MSSLIQLASAPVSEPVLLGPLTDSFGRIHSDLRISVTDRCNIRCFYCMPEAGVQYSKASALLSFDEIMRFVSTAVSLGVRKIRLTGGEPLLRPRLTTLIGSLCEVPGIADLALTTNAVLLADAARPLYEAGLRRLNIHLDSLDRERFRRITRRDDLPRVLAGIDAAIATGFRSIKLNAVAIQGLTEPDIVPLVDFGRERNIEIRFIEFMPLDAQQIWSMERVLTADQIIDRLSRQFGRLEPVRDADPRAPATEYAFTDGYRVGFIASVSRPFCMNCNRLRLTSDGKLRNCLFAHEETAIRHLLGSVDQVPALETAIRTTVWRKGAGHEINQASFAAPQRPMYSIGG